MRVLIADDDPMARLVARLSLETHAGATVFEAADGYQCIRIARTENPDCILLDAFMPGFDGVATLDALRSDESTAGIPVVFLTAALPEVLPALGAATIRKPFDPKELPAMLLAILDGHPRI